MCTLASETLLWETVPWAWICEHQRPCSFRALWGFKHSPEFNDSGNLIPHFHVHDGRGQHTGYITSGSTGWWECCRVLQYNLVHRMPQSCTASALLLKDFQPSEQQKCWIALTKPDTLWNTVGVVGMWFVHNSNLFQAMMSPSAASIQEVLDSNIAGSSK